MISDQPGGTTLDHWNSGNGEGTSGEGCEGGERNSRGISDAIYRIDRIGKGNNSGALELGGGTL